MDNRRRLGSSGECPRSRKQRRCKHGMSTHRQPLLPKGINLFLLGVCGRTQMAGSSHGRRKVKPDTYNQFQRPVSFLLVFLFFCGVLILIVFQPHGVTPSRSMEVRVSQCVFPETREKDRPINGNSNIIIATVNRGDNITRRVILIP